MSVLIDRTTRLLVQGRDENFEGCASTRLAFKIYEAAVVLHYSVDHRQSQSGSFAWLLSGKEGLENMVLDVLGHPLTGVGNGERNVIAVSRHEMRSTVFFIQTRILRANQELSAVRHRVFGIQSKIYEDLLQLREIRVDAQEVVRQLQVDLNHFRKRPDKDVLHVVHYAVQIHGTASCFGGSAEGKYPLYQVCSVPCGTNYLLEVCVILVALLLVFQH